TMALHVALPIWGEREEGDCRRCQETHATLQRGQNVHNAPSRKLQFSRSKFGRVELFSDRWICASIEKSFLIRNEFSSVIRYSRSKRCSSGSISGSAAS